MTPDQIAKFLKELKSPEDLASFAKALQVKSVARDAGAAADRSIVRRAFGTKLKAGSLNEEARSVRVVASTTAIDSYGDVVEQNWRLERYELNPCVLYGHNYVGFLGLGGDPSWTLPVGFATDVTVTNQLEATLNFVDEKANPMAVKVWEGFRQQSIRAVSVGFYPHKVTRVEEEGKDDVYHLDDNELFEISAVPLPANYEAVALSAERSAEREWFRARALKIKTTVQVPKGAKAPEKKTMDLEQLKAELESAQKALKAANDALTAKTAELATKTGELEAANKKNGELETDLKSVKTELETATKSLGEKTAELAEKTKKLTELEDKAIEAEVDALVGKKFAPAEREEMLELRRTNPDLFARTMKKRGDMPHTKTIVSGDPVTGASGGAIAKAMNKAVADAEEEDEDEDD